MDGRILLNFTALKELDSGALRRIVVQPTVSVNAGASADDAWLGFGKRQSWGMKVGRFEAYDMSSRSVRTSSSSTPATAPTICTRMENLKKLNK